MAPELQLPELERTDPGGTWHVPPGSLEPLWLPDNCVYDPELPDQFEYICEELLVWPHGHRAGQPVIWEQFQRDRLIRPLLGVVDKATRQRVIKTCFYLSARGTGKTALAAALAIYALAFMTDDAPSVDLFAVSRPLATKMFNMVELFIRRSRGLETKLAIYESTKIVKFRANGGEMAVRSGDAKAELGGNPFFAFLDELLAQRNRDLYDAIETSFGKRPEQVFMMMTTPDPKPESFAKQEYRRAKQIEKARKLDKTYLPIIYEAGKDDDPHSEKTWHKAHPGLQTGMFPVDQYRTESAAAQLNPTKLHAFKVYRLALWVDTGSNFINEAVWTQNIMKPPDIEALRKMPCTFGLDMSGSSDFSSLCMLWRMHDNSFYALWRHWCTRLAFDRVNEYTQGMLEIWSEMDSVDLTVTDKRLIDTQDVADVVIKDAGTFEPWAIGIDSYRSRDLMDKLENYGATLLSSTGRSMEAATERLGTSIHAGMFHHNGDRLAQWMGLNTVVKYDTQNYPKLIKRSTTTDNKEVDHNVRIDAISAAQMAIDRRNAWERLYEKEETEPSNWYFIPD